MWPPEADFRDKLWESKKELQQTTASSSRTSTSKLDMPIPGFVRTRSRRRRRRRRRSMCSSADRVVFLGSSAISGKGKTEHDDHNEIVKRENTWDLFVFLSRDLGRVVFQLLKSFSCPTKSPLILLDFNCNRVAYNVLQIHKKHLKNTIHRPPPSQLIAVLLQMIPWRGGGVFKIAKKRKVACMPLMWAGLAWWLVLGRTTPGFGSPFSSKKIVIYGSCLVTLHCTMNETVKWLTSLAHVDAEIIMVVTV